MPLGGGRPRAANHACGEPIVQAVERGPVRNGPCYRVFEFERCADALGPRADAARECDTPRRSVTLRRGTPPPDRHRAEDRTAQVSRPGSESGAAIHWRRTHLLQDLPRNAYVGVGTQVQVESRPALITDAAHALLGCTPQLLRRRLALGHVVIDRNGLGQRSRAARPLRRAGASRRELRYTSS